MKILTGASVLFLLLFFANSINSRNYSSFVNPMTQTSQNEQLIPEINLKVQAESPQPEIPQNLVIPKIGLNSQIVAVNLNQDKIVDTPATLIGWYESSPYPGSTGIAALNGHFLNSDGSPGVFNRISELSEGDEIHTVDANGGVFKFRVVKKDLVNASEFPLEEVYGHSDIPMLTLVTCAGNFLVDKDDYDRRTIIYADLIPE